MSRVAPAACGCRRGAAGCRRSQQSASGTRQPITGRDAVTIKPRRSADRVRLPTIRPNPQDIENTATKIVLQSKPISISALTNPRRKASRGSLKGENATFYRKFQVRHLLAGVWTKLDAAAPLQTSTRLSSRTSERHSTVITGCNAVSIEPRRATRFDFHSQTQPRSRVNPALFRRDLNFSRSTSVGSTQW